MADDFSSIGARIGHIRRLRGLSQETLAGKVQISRTYMGFIECGRSMPTIDVLYKIAEALDVELADILSVDGTILSALKDCSDAERDILIENLKALKGILRDKGVTSGKEGTED